MIYLVGGAPRSGKSTLGQKVASKLGVGWVATDVLRSLLKDEDASGWNASPEAISAVAAWFSPHLERFVWGINSQAEHYLIEGVHFLPEQVSALANHYSVRSVFLGCSNLTLERFDAFPGRSRGYVGLPPELKRQIVRDVPKWSAYVAEKAASEGLPYLDMNEDFGDRLEEAEHLLVG